MTEALCKVAKSMWVVQLEEYYAGSSFTPVRKFVVLDQFNIHSIKGKLFHSFLISSLKLCRSDGSLPTPLLHSIIRSVQMNKAFLPLEYIFKYVGPT